MMLHAGLVAPLVIPRYAIPLIQKILEAKLSSEPSGSGDGCVRALVLVPSKELSQQAATNIKVG